MVDVVTKVQRKEQVEDIIVEVGKKLMDQIDAEPTAAPTDHLRKLNRDGKMLMCNFTLNQREGAPDPLCITVNDQIKWVKRGQNVVIPWYFVEHMKLNIERKYRQEKDPQTGRAYIVAQDQLSESFQYQPIDPAPGVTV